MVDNDVIDDSPELIDSDDWERLQRVERELATAKDTITCLNVELAKNNLRNEDVNNVLQNIEEDLNVLQDKIRKCTGELEYDVSKLFHRMDDIYELVGLKDETD